MPCFFKRSKCRKSPAVSDRAAVKMSLRVPQTSSPGAAADAAKKLLVVGLCGEAIKVEWSPEDTVGQVKDKTFSAASNTLLADGSRCSLVQGSCFLSRADRSSLTSSNRNDNTMRLTPRLSLAGIAPDQLFLAFGDQEHVDPFRDEAQRLDELLRGVK